MKNNTMVRRAASVLPACAFAGLAAAAPQVEVFTPRGEAKGVRQVAVRFTEPIVTFGDPPGRHTLRLVDEKGAEFDRVQITVRGLALRRAAFMENLP